MKINLVLSALCALGFGQASLYAMTPYQPTAEQKAAQEAAKAAPKQVAVGEMAPAFNVVDEFSREMSLASLRGRTVILSVFPSINTGVCAIQTRKFNEEATSLGDYIQVVSISRDKPEDFSKFCAAHGIKNMLNFSDKWHEFGDFYALNLPNSKWTGRAAFVIDPNGKVVYAEYVKQLGAQPNYEAVISAAKAAAEGTPRFMLPVLPYSRDALQPVISEKTIDYHYGKHLQAYVNNVNNMVKGTKYEGMALEDIIKESKEGALFNNAAQTHNHRLYFDQFSPLSSVGTGKPTGALLAAIDKEWGSFENFVKSFNTACGKVFGSGWVWLVKDAEGKLSIVSTSNASTPITQGLTPLLAIDVWEHSYYLDYENRRAEHVDKVWGIINWNVVAARFAQK